MNTYSKVAEAAFPKKMNIKKNQNSKSEIVFWDFKGYWSDVLESKIIPKFNCMDVDVLIRKWDTNYDEHSSVFDEVGNLVSSFNNNALNVFVAPITWSGLYTEYVSIIGPAFATNGDIKLYSWPNKNPYAKEIKIGIIEQLATSTISLQIIMKAICNFLNKSNYLQSPLSEADGESRLERLKNLELVAAVFNSEEFNALIKSKRIKINDILDIDELYSLAKKIDNLPRVVYAVAKQQTETCKIGLTILKNVFNSLKVNLIKAHNNKHVLAPFNELNRDAVCGFIEDCVNTLPDINYIRLDKFKNNLV